MRAIDLHFTDHHRVPPNPLQFTMHFSRTHYSTCRPPVFASSALYRSIYVMLSNLACSRPKLGAPPPSHAGPHNHSSPIAERRVLLSFSVFDRPSVSRSHKERKQITITHGKVTTEKKREHHSRLSCATGAEASVAPQCYMKMAFVIILFRYPLLTGTFSCPL